MTKVRDEFFKEMALTSNMPSDLIGVTALGRKEMKIEIAVTAVVS